MAAVHPLPAGNLGDFVKGLKIQRTVANSGETRNVIPAAAPSEGAALQLKLSRAAAQRAAARRRARRG